MTDLEWLARNVHEWPKKEQGRFILASKYYSQYEEGIVDCKSGTTKHQWLAERARLQNKPNWDYAPDWANYLAQDANGAWVFYEYEPRTHQDGYWFLHDKLKQVSESGKVLGDWRNTLEKRPEDLVGVRRITEGSDVVTKPSHYQLLPEYEVKHINEALLNKIEQSDFDMSLYEAGWYQQSMQYFMRFYGKNGLEDLEKGIETMQIVVDSLKKRGVN